jgi:hypothetical protein
MLHLFEACGIELEYMIVRRDDLVAAPVADELLRAASDNEVEWPDEITVGFTGWSNELVLHVIEMKTATPTADLAAAEADIVRSIDKASAILRERDPPCMLLGTSAHPFFHPGKEMRLWPHGAREIYAAYDRIFGCTGHGWSNLQSLHLNLPFADDEEFGRLHAASRLLLPVLPALCASSPFLESRRTSCLDTRLEYYRTNQSRIPSITGDVIPEPIFTMQEYHELILEKMYNDIAPYDPDRILQHEWLNSRGAIARFDRMAIEIRLMDIQECPGMDMATAAFVFLMARAICEERFARLSEVKKAGTQELVDLLNRVIQTGRHAIIDEEQILAGFGLRKSISVKDMLQQLLDKLASEFSTLTGGDPSTAGIFTERIQFLLDHGSPAERMLQYIPGDTDDDERLRILYGYLARCLAGNRPLPPHRP